MPLTPDEILQRRLTDPYFGQAEKLALPSLAQQKGISLAAASVEKKRRLDPAQSLADEAIAEDKESNYLSNLLDIGEASFYRERENLFDFISGREPVPGEDRNAQVQAFADAEAGVTEQVRQEEVTGPQQKVFESLARGGTGFLEAIPEAIKAGPATLMDSVGVLAEIGAGSLLTAFAGGAGVPLLARRGKKVLSGGKKFLGKVDETRDNLAKLAMKEAKGAEQLKAIVGAAPRAAAQVSIATMSMTQAQINDFTNLHGVAPTREQAAGMYALTMATMMPTPAIIKNLFVPKFKQQIGKEIQNLGKNLGSGSNIKSIAARVVEGSKKVGKAGGAEAVQEYFQTWAENLNVSMGPEQRKEFFQGVLDVLGDKDKQLEALAGAYLGGGAGGTARLGITAPAVATGTAIDTTKGTAKTAVKAVGAGVKATGRVIQNVANKAGLKVLSQEERNVIASEYGSRKATVDVTEDQFETAVDKVKASTTIEDIRNTLGATPPITQAAAETMAKALASLDENSTPKDLERVKHKVVAAYRGDLDLVKANLEASNVASIAKKVGKNVQTASVDTATAALEAVDPGIKAIKSAVKDLPPKVQAAAAAVRSSAARGIIDLAATAGKKEVATIVEAAKGLSLDDLKRTTNVVNQIKPEVGRQLERIVKQKEKQLKRVGLKVDEIVNDETLNPIIRDVAKRAVVAAKEISQLSSAVNKVVASKIDDLVALKDTEAAVAAIEKSDSFKKQINGAMTKENLETVKRKLASARVRLEGEGVTIKDKVVQGAKDAVQAATPVVKAAAESVGRAVKGATAEPINISGTFRAVVEGVENSLKDPKQVAVLVAAAPDFIKQLKKFGVESRAQFEALIKQFPVLQENVPFYNAISDAYPSDINVKEVYDNLVTQAVAGTKDIAAAVKKAYNELNTDPACKI